MSITIKHLSGPLTGSPDQTFDDSFDSVVFGRDPEKCQVVYPPDYNVVGKQHFELKRDKAGDYSVGLFGKRYVEIDGTQADVDAPVVTGNVLRLGRKDGPSFKVETAKLKVVGLEDTGDQGTMLTPAERDRLLRRRLVYAGGVIAAALVGVIYYNDWRTSQLDYQLAAMAGEASERAKKEFSEAELDRLKGAVYVVGKKVDETTTSRWQRLGHLLPISWRPTRMWRHGRKRALKDAYVLFRPRTTARSQARFRSRQSRFIPATLPSATSRGASVRLSGGASPRST